MDTGSGSEVSGSLSLIDRMSQVIRMRSGPRATFLWDFDADRLRIEETAVAGAEYLWVVLECATHLFVLGLGSPNSEDQRGSQVRVVKSLARSYGDTSADWFHARAKPGGSSVLCAVNATRAVALVSGAGQRIVSGWHRSGPQSGHVELQTTSGAFAGSAALGVSEGLVVDVAVELAVGLTLADRMYATLEVELWAPMIAGSLFFRFGNYTVNGMGVNDVRSAWREEDRRCGRRPASAASMSSAACLHRGAMMAGLS